MAENCLQSCNILCNYIVALTVGSDWEGCLFRAARKENNDNDDNNCVNSVMI